MKFTYVTDKQTNTFSNLPRGQTYQGDAESVATSATLKFEKQFPEATTPPLPTPKSTDSGTNAASASLKFEKQFPDATTPPQPSPLSSSAPAKTTEAEKLKPSSDGSDSSARKVAALSLPASPPPPYSTSVTQTATWITSSSSNNSKAKREVAPSTI
uniref:Uncharacterized protein n=1 Tax=Panagrolaimus sp. ES5 TaxID=591445 RepID=A0AC34GH08_9BILA